MARKKTSGVRKKTGSAVPPSKGKKSKASVKKTSPKKRDIRYLPDLQMSDEDTLPSGTDPFEDNGLGSPDCVPIVVKKKSAPVEIITLDNEDTIVTPDSKFLEMTFSEEDPKDDDDRPTPHSSSKQGFDFGRSIQLLSGSSKNQKLVHEPECNETFEMTFSVENIKKEPVDYDSDFDYGNPFSQNLSAKNWTEGKLLSMDEIKKEVPDEDEDDVPLSMLCSLGKKSQVVSEENKICQMMTHPKMDGMAEKMTSDSQGKLSSDCPVMIPNIKTEKIDLSDDPGIVNKTAKPTTKKPNARAKKKSPNVIKDNLALKNLRSNDNTISDVGNSKNQIVDQNVSDNSLSQFQPVNKSNVSGNSLSQFQPVNKSNVSGNSLSQFQPVNKSNVSGNSLSQFQSVNKSNVSGNSLSQFQPVNKSNVSGNSLSQFKPVNKSNVSGNSLSQFQPVNKSNVSGNSLSQFQPVNKSNVSGKCDTDVPGLNIKIKQEPLSDSEEGCQKGNTKTIEMPEVRGTVLNKKNDSKSTAASDIMVLSVKIKQEPLSDSEDATKETDSCVSVESQGINKAEAGPDLNPKAVVSSMSSKDNQTHEKEMAISEMVGSPVESRSLVVTSASDEFRKGKNMSANVTNSNSGENTRLPTSSMNELLSKELAPIKNASLNFGTLEKLNPTERVAAEVISSLPAEKLQELIRGIAEARKLDLKPVLEENIAKSETDPAKLKEPVNQESSRQETVESMKIKTEIPESAKHSVVSQPSNAKAEESPKPSSDLHVPDVNLSSSVSPDVIKNVDDKVSAGQAVGKQGLYHDSVTSVSVQDCPSISSSQAANSLPCNSEIKSKDSAIDMNQLMSAENLQNILKTASSLQDSGSIAGSLQDELLRSHQLTNSSVSSDELSNQTQFNDKDQKLISLSTDFLRTVIKTVEASASQGKQSGDESCTSCMTEFSSTGFSELSNKQKHANLETPIVKQEEKSSDTCGNVAKGKDCEKLKVEKSEDEIIDESPDAKRCKTETFEDDYSQVSMECSQPSESENEEHPGSNTRKKRKRKRPRIQKNKKVKKETFHDSCSKQSADEISPEKDIQVLKSEDQNLNSVKNEKVLPPNSLDTSEKSAPKLESNSVRKKLNDSIVEVIKLSGKGQTVPSKGKGSSSRELDHLKPKRKVPSPKRKSADKESALFDVENDPDVVSSKASNKVQRFASRNEFLTKEMLPDDKSVKSSQKQKFKWFKEKKSEPANFQEGHLLVKSPEIDDIHFGDSGNKIEVVVRGGHVNNMSHSLDPRLNRTNSFPAKHAKLNIEEYKEKYRNSTYSGSEFQQIHQMPVSTSNYSTMQQTVFQTNSYWNQSNSANPHPSSVEMTESTLRNPVFSPFQQPVATQSFFPNNSPAVLPSAQPFVPSQGFSLPLQSVISPQNLPSITSNIPVQAVPPTQNLLNITQNPVQAVPPPAQNLPGVTRNVPVQPVRPLQSLPTMTQKVPPVSPLSSTIPPLTFPPPPIRKHLPQQFPSISNVASPPPQPVDAAYSSRFQSTSLRGCFPSPENSLPVQSFAPPLPPQPPPKVDVPPPPPLPPSDFFPPPPPPASPPPDSSPTKSMSLASSSPSLSPPASSPPLQFETSPAKSLSSEFSSTVSKNSISAKFMSSVHGSYSVEQNTRIPSSTPEQLGSCTPSSTPELFFSRPPSSELNDSSTRDSLHFPKVSTQETNSVSIRHSVTSVDSNVQGRTQGNNTKFSSKSSITFKDMTKANSSSKDLLFLILSWSVSWLPQQIQITDPPPITEKVKPVEPSYACYKDYYDTYFPLLLHETWETIFLAWRQAKVIHYFCNVTDHKPEGRLLEMQCNTIISSTTLTEGRYPAEGFLVIIKFGLSNSNGSTKMYGYVSQHSVRPFEIKSDFSNPCLKYLVHQPGEEVSVLSLTIRTAYKCDKIDFSVLPRIQVVHSLKPILKQYDALLNLRVSPLCKGILSADSALCKVISLSKQKNPSTAVVVEEIANLILKPDLAPQIIVIEALPGTDKMNTLVKLIQRLKSAETAKKKTQLLLCSRTNEVVDEVGCHLVLSQEEEDEKKKVLCVRLGRMSDIHPEMRKYSLEDLSAKEVARVKKQQLVKPERELSEAAQKCAKTEIDYKTLLKLSLKLAEKLKKQLVAEQTILSNKQKQKERVLLEHTMYHQRYLNEAQSTIIKTSDVILSTVANCHQTEVDNTCGRNSSMPLDCCIIDDASQCTELETLLPLLYGTSKLVLLGDPNISPRVLSKTASTYKYDLSYYQRVFSQVKIR